MKIRRAYIATAFACLVLASTGAQALGQDSQGADSVIDRPPNAVPQYGRSNLPDSTMSGGMGFSFPGGGTKIPLPDPCATNPTSANCKPPVDEGTGGSGNPTTPPTGAVDVTGDWSVCAVRQSGSVSYSFSYGSDGLAYTGPSTAAPTQGRWMPVGDNAARYSISFPDVPDVNPRPDGTGWINMGNGVSGSWTAKPTKPGMPAAQRIHGQVRIREDATGSIISSVAADIYLTVAGECL